ncbi:MAG: hypothetical protein SFW66_08920 [Gammaproteobacteria bacterium]|nr:hypothetical protein [Gammaproteobacteria bacterium]
MADVNLKMATLDKDTNKQTGVEDVSMSFESAYNLMFELAELFGCKVIVPQISEDLKN